MANHETHSVIAGGIESDLHIDSSKYPHPFCSLLQKRAHFDSFKHLIFIRGLLAIAHGKRKNKISASMVSFYVSLQPGCTAEKERACDAALSRL
ncbi:hypothetical protein O5254_26895, partial [Escherichia coli]|nr:hypothetical protein [Escherichia coli]